VALLLAPYDRHSLLSSSIRLRSVDVACPVGHIAFSSSEDRLWTRPASHQTTDQLAACTKMSASPSSTTIPSKCTPLSTATTTSTDTGQTITSRSATSPTNTPTTQLERSAAQRLRTTMAAVKLAFTWLGVRKTLAPEQRTTAARAFHADRELLSASKLILDTKNPTYRAVVAVRSEASTYWRTVTLPFPEAGIRLLPQNSLGLFANTMQTYRERLQEAARELASQYDTIKSEAQRRLGTLYNASDYPSTLDGLFDLEV